VSGATTAAVRPYAPLHPSRSEFLALRGLRHHLRHWTLQQAGGSNLEAPLLVLLHGWMDVSASFQFVVDCLRKDWRVVAPDWRGYGLSERTPSDCYWFPDYLADLDGLLQALSPDEPVRLVAHSMGGNVAMLYAGIRPHRVRGLVNLEGFGMPRSHAAEAPGRYRQWLDELRAPPAMRDYGSMQEVAERLVRNNPRLAPDRAAWLAGHWAAPAEGGRLQVLGDPAHRIVNPVLYRVEEAVAVWREITAPVLLAWCDESAPRRAAFHTPEYRDRLAAIRRLREVRIAGAGHMLHHDQPAEVARLIEAFFEDA
jgi:pimeloyl-ACP methyl ester carboxylesterase